ncbi:hypothetical protein [Ponticoccus sp. (in: a-proteobacteria)]|uniref:COG3904 family protein n=1 Tax=Ponticoccus sp. (in: a-proteobacteria) TaxID=1925025 RepID=UPI003AB706C9
MRLFPALMLAAASLAAPVTAAVTLSEEPGPMGCTATLSGPLTPESAQAFAAFTAEQGWQAEVYGTRRLCLDSPGGDYGAALEIARQVAGLGMGTAVGPGATCDSACALMFMAGQRQGEEDLPLTDRQLHPRGRLGFDAPALVTEDRSHSRAEIDAAYGVALRSLRDLLALRDDIGMTFAESLLLEMLATPPGEMRRIATVGDAARWRMPVTPTAAPDAPREALVEQACANAQSARYGTPVAAGISDALSLIDTAIETPDGGVRVTTLPAFLGEGAYACTVTLFPEPQPGGAIGEVSFGSGGFTEALATLYPYMMHPPDTVLTDLPVAGPDPVAALKPVLLASDARPFAPAAGDSCWIAGPEVAVSEVSEYVNLRGGTGFGAEILREVPLGEALTLIGNPVVAGRQDERQSCAAACRSMAADPEDPGHAGAVRGCIARNAVWYRVRDAEGTEGFISRKFLRAR